LIQRSGHPLLFRPVAVSQQTTTLRLPQATREALGKVHKEIQPADTVPLYVTVSMAVELLAQKEGIDLDE
jgi:hypothetical protein